MSVEFLQSLEDTYDIVLFLNVFHHITKDQSEDYVNSIFYHLERLAPVVIFEAGWNKHYPESLKDNLGGQAARIEKLARPSSNFKAQVLGKDNTYGRAMLRLDLKLPDVSTMLRPMKASNRRWWVSEQVILSRPPIKVFAEYNLEVNKAVGKYLKAFPHPNILRVYGVEPNGDWITEGLPDADTVLHADAMRKSLPKILTYLRKHQIVHRDISRSNLVWNRFTQEYTLVDWDWACFSGTDIYRPRTGPVIEDWKPPLWFEKLDELCAEYVLEGL